MALIKGKQLKDSAIVAAKIADNAIITTKITDANVTTAKLADDAVTAAKLANGAVVTASIVDSNVNTAKLADDAVTAAKLASNAVATASIIDANVTTAKIADSAVTKAKLENLADMKVLGNTSGGSAAPSEVSILDEDTLASNSATSLASQQSIKAYVDSVAQGLDPKEGVEFSFLADQYNSSYYVTQGHIQTQFTFDSTNQIWVQNTAGKVIKSEKVNYGSSGVNYVIVSNQSPQYDFTAVGSSSNSSGTTFTANSSFSFSSEYSHVEVRKQGYLKGLHIDLDEELPGVRALVRREGNPFTDGGIFEFTEGKGDTVLDATSELISGRRYTITTAGSSMNWTSIGASDGNVGTSFVYSGATVTGSGGQVKERYVLSRVSDFATGMSVAGASIFVNSGEFGNSNYVVVSDKYDSGGGEVESANGYSFSTGAYYEIVELGNTNWSTWGVSNATVGTIFKPTATTSGSGTGTLRVRKDIVSGYLTFTKFNSPSGVVADGGLALSGSLYKLDKNNLPDYDQAHSSSYSRLYAGYGHGLLANGSSGAYFLEWRELLVDLLDGGHGIGAHTNSSNVVSMGSTSANNFYIIESLGTTSWTDLGATSAKVGVPFKASSSAYNISTSSLVNGKLYRITNTGSSVNWTAIGAANGNNNTEFTYNGTTVTASTHGAVTLAAGTGTVKGYSTSGFNLKLAASIGELTNVDITTSAPTNGQALTWNGTNFVPATLLSNVVEDTTPQLGGNLDVNGNDIVSTSNGNIELDPNGSGVVIFKGNATKGSGQFKLNCENNSHGITIKGPAHSAGADYTLTLPTTDGNANQVLKTDGSGGLSWVDQTSGGSGTAEEQDSEVISVAVDITSGGAGFVHISTDVDMSASSPSLSSGDYVVVTAVSGSPTHANLTSAGFTGISVDLTASSGTAAATGLILRAGSVSQMTTNYVTVRKVFTPASTTKGDVQLSFNGLIQKIPDAFTFVPATTSGVGAALSSNASLTAGTHFLKYTYTADNVSLETDDVLILSYTK